MPHKYQQEIDNFSFPPDFTCPNKVKPINEEIIVYRFSINPVSDPLNFLPNVLFDQNRGIVTKYKKGEEEKVCLRCGASFYLSEDSAKFAWKSAAKKFRNNSGYTHIAYGKLNSNDGVMSKPHDDHFTFYEDISANLPAKFDILCPL